MGPDKLQSLLYAYIENRRFEDVDDVTDGPWRHAVEIDNPAPFRRYDEVESGNGHSSLVAQGGLVSPVYMQFSPFGPLNAHSQQSANAAGRRLSQLARQHSTAYPDKSLVKFKEICLVVEPKEQTVSVPVIREKACIDKETRVSWETCDKTAVSGTHFVGSTGEIVFGVGDTEKFIEIKILDFTDKADDLHFTVTMPDCGGNMFVPTPLTITLKKVNCFYTNENNVLNDLPRSLPISIDNIRYVVQGCLTNRTFHMALTHLCSTSHDIDIQIALALELTVQCYKNNVPDSVWDVLWNYFRNVQDDVI